MPETRPFLERVMERVELRPFTLEGFHDRRDRKRRNQRIAAGVVGIAVFVAAVWIVTTGPFDQSQTEGVPGGAATGPAVTEPPVVTGPPGPPELGWDGATPPEGTPPSTPEEGKLVARSFEAYGPIFAYVYADGRVITQERGYGFLTERRLTPEGVDLVRSGDIPAEYFLGSDYDIPADAWEDPEIKPFVPSRYAVCYWMAKGNGNPGTINNGYEYPSTVLGFLPARARDILRGDVIHGEVDIADPSIPVCSEVTTDEARALEQILSDVRVEDSEGDEIISEFQAILPHGVNVGYCSPNPCG